VDIIVCNSLKEVMMVIIFMKDWNDYRNNESIIKPFFDITIWVKTYCLKEGKLTKNSNPKSIKIRNGRLLSMKGLTLPGGYIIIVILEIPMTMENECQQPFFKLHMLLMNIWPFHYRMWPWFVSTKATKVRSFDNCIV